MEGGVSTTLSSYSDCVRARQEGHRGETTTEWCDTPSAAPYPSLSGDAGTVPNTNTVRPVAALGTQRDFVSKRAAALPVDAVASLVSDALGYPVSVVLSLAAIGYLDFVYVQGTYDQTIGKRVMNIVGDTVVVKTV